MSYNKRAYFIRAAKAKNLEKRIINRVDMATCFNLSDKTKNRFDSQHEKWGREIDELFEIEPDYEKAWNMIKKAGKSG